MARKGVQEPLSRFRDLAGSFDAIFMELMVGASFSTSLINHSLQVLNRTGMVPRGPSSSICRAHVQLGL